MIAVREFRTGDECRAHAAALRAKFFSPKAKRAATENAPEQPSPPPIPFMALKLPEWKARPTYFDTHVIESRRILEMIKAGEIEIYSTERKTIQEIVVEVLRDFPEITVPDLKSSRRSRALCLARQMAMYEVRHQRPDLSFPMIGRWFGGRDHTTVLHAIRKIDAMKGDFDPQYLKKRNASAERYRQKAKELKTATASLD